MCSMSKQDGLPHMCPMFSNLYLILTHILQEAASRIFTCQILMPGAQCRTAFCIRLLGNGTGCLRVLSRQLMLKNLKWSFMSSCHRSIKYIVPMAFYSSFAHDYKFFVQVQNDIWTPIEISSDTFLVYPRLGNFFTLYITILCATFVYLNKLLTYYEKFALSQSKSWAWWGENIVKNTNQYAIWLAKNEN